MVTVQQQPAPTLDIWPSRELAAIQLLWKWQLKKTLGTAETLPAAADASPALGQKWPFQKVVVMVFH